ncbi:MAG: MFS transporter [Gammaproteobacteria bacterium]
MTGQPGDARALWSWALYDWANSGFATTVMAGFFPVFFKEFWAAGLSPTDSTFQLGLANSIASLCVVVLAPLLGALADRAGAKKRLLALFAYLGVAMAASLFWVAEGAWPLALLVYALGIIGFAGANVSYDALLLDAAPRERLDRVSALGYAMGYLGGGLLFAVNVAMVLRPGWFGLADAAQAVQVAFLTVAVWWGMFSLPVLLFVEETAPRLPPRPGGLVRGTLADLGETFRHVRRYRYAFLFLVAYWFYIDGVDTIVRMAVDYGLAIGFSSADLLSALLLTQLIGFPAAIGFGRLAERWSPKRGIGIAILVYVLAVFWAWQMSVAWEFYTLAVIIGLVQGGIQALSRSFYARLIPRHRAGEFFGFYNMLGKFAAVLGPLMVGWVAATSGDSRFGILSVILLFLIGAAVLTQVDMAAGERQAQAEDRQAGI